MVPFMTWSLKSHTVTFIILVIRSESLSLEHTQGEGDSDPSLKEGEYYRIPWSLGTHQNGSTEVLFVGNHKSFRGVAVKSKNFTEVNIVY